MSIADEIRNMNNKFLSDKTQQTLKGMTLQDLAVNWQEVDRQLENDAVTRDEQNKNIHIDRQKQKKAKGEAMEKFSKAITPQELESKLQSYQESLDKGSYDAADFYGIDALLNDYADTNSTDSLKQRISDMKSKISSARLNPLKPVSLKTANTALGSAKAVVSADNAVVSSLADKKLKNGKTVTFQNNKNEDFAAVSFDDKGRANIWLIDDKGQKADYTIMDDGKIGRLGSDKIWPIDESKMTEQDKKALDLAKESEKIWISYAEGKMDKNIEKDEGVNVDEGGNKEKEVTINQDKKETSKVHEFNPLINMRDPTKVNEGEKPEEIDKREAEVGGDDLNPSAKKEDEEYWKEGDIIDTMFKWLVAGANSATNFVVHQVEYFAGAVWHQFEKDVINAKAEEPQKANATQKLYKETNDIYKRRMQESKRSCDKKRIAELLKDGKIDTLMAENPAFAALYQQSPNLRKVMSPEFLKSEEGKKNAPSIIASTITMTESFTNKYAKESILNEKMTHKGAFKDDNLEEVFTQRKNDGLDILIANMEKITQEKISEIQKEDPSLAKDYIEKNLGMLISDSLVQSVEAIDKAADINNKNYKSDKYDEFKKIPDKNTYLEQLEALRPLKKETENENAPTPEPREEHPEPTQEPAAEPAQEPEPDPVQEPAPEPQPRNLQEEFEDQRRRDEMHQTLLNGFDQQETVAAGREDNNDEKRRRITEFKNSVLHGLGDKTSHTAPVPPLTRESTEEGNKPQIPFPYRGR